VWVDTAVGDLVAGRIVVLAERVLQRLADSVHPTPEVE